MRKNYSKPAHSSDNKILKDWKNKQNNDANKKVFKTYSLNRIDDQFPEYDFLMQATGDGSLLFQNKSASKHVNQIDFITNESNQPPFIDQPNRLMMKKKKDTAKGAQMQQIDQI